MVQTRSTCILQDFLELPSIIINCLALLLLLFAANIALWRRVADRMAEIENKLMNQESAVDKQSFTVKKLRQQVRAARMRAATGLRVWEGATKVKVGKGARGSSGAQAQQQAMVSSKQLWWVRRSSLSTLARPVTTT